jgi:Ca-activated chloride channel family protein
MRRGCGALLLLAMARLAAGQGDIKVDVDVVNVLCTVHDKRGALVTNLAKDDFRIREDGMPQQIRYFARETDLPLTVALLVDMSGSVSPFIRAEKGTAAQFFRDVLRPEDHALLIGFSSTIVLWQDLTASVRELRVALARMRGVAFHGLPPLGQPMPSTLLYKAVYSTASEKLKTVAGRKAMLIISDGLDVGSPIKLEQAVRAVQTTNTVVFGICYENRRLPGCSYLKNLSEPTGGRMFRVDAQTSLAKIFQIIEDELRSQYSLGYVSTNPARNGKFRKLRVEVRRKGLRVDVRKGYYVPGPPAP